MVDYRRRPLALRSEDANIAQQLVATGRMPTSLEELQGKTEYVAPKAFNVPQRPADAFRRGLVGGYGDPRT